MGVRRGYGTRGAARAAKSPVAIRANKSQAKNKVWPGEDASEIRAFHENQGNDELREKTDWREPEPQSPNTGLTSKELDGLKPESEVARVVRRASAEGTYSLPPIKRLRRITALAHANRDHEFKNKKRGLTPKEILGDMHWSNIGRAHYLILLLQATNHYALPQFMHECDPLEIMEIAERMDLWKATVERMYRKAA